MSNNISTNAPAATTPAAIAQRIDKALVRSIEAGQASLRRAYGEDTREGAPKSLATAIKYARDAVLVLSGEAKLPSKGERRSFIKRINDVLSAADALTETLAVEVARDVVAADRRRRNEARAEASAAKRANLAELNAALAKGNPEAAAQAAILMAEDARERANAQRGTHTERFTKAAADAVASGLTVIELFDILAAACGVDNPVFAQPVAA